MCYFIADSVLYEGIVSLASCCGPCVLGLMFWASCFGPRALGLTLWVPCFMHHVLGIESMH